MHITHHKLTKTLSTLKEDRTLGEVNKLICTIHEWLKLHTCRDSETVNKTPRNTKRREKSENHKGVSSMHYQSQRWKLYLRDCAPHKTHFKLKVFSNITHDVAESQSTQIIKYKYEQTRI